VILTMYLGQLLRLELSLNRRTNVFFTQKKIKKGYLHHE